MVLSDSLIVSFTQDPERIALAESAKGLVFVAMSGLLMYLLAVRRQGMSVESGAVVQVPPRSFKAVLRSRPFLLSLMIFMTAVGIGAVFVNIKEQGRVLSRQKAATDIVTVHGRALQDQINQSLSATYALAAVLRQGNGKIDDFESLAYQMLPLYGGVSSLQLAPNGIVSRIVPLYGNEKAIGHDLLKDPKRNAEAFLAVKTKMLTLAGPFELIQGGVAVVGRLPVFLPDDAGKERFWGFTTALIRIDDLIKASNLQQLIRAGYHYKLSRIHPDTRKRQYFASSIPGMLDDPISFDIEVPNGKWALTAAPVDGWHSFGGMLTDVVTGLIFSLLAWVIAYTVLRRPELLRVQVDLRTRELAQANEQLAAEIVERRQAQENLTHLNRLYALLSETNHAIVRITERDALLREICRIAVEHGGLRLAWIGLADPASKLLKPLAFSGADEADVEKIKIAAADDSQWPNLASVAANATPATCENCTNNPNVTCWKRDFTKQFRSCTALPLRIEQQIIGTFNLYSDEENFFNESQVAVLEEIAEDVSFALEHIEHEARRLAAEERIRKLSRAVDQSANAVMITDIHGTIEYVNPKFSELTGYASEEVIGQNPRILKSGELSADTYKEMWNTLLAGKEWYGEFHNRKKSGEPFWCLESISPLKNEQGEITHFVSVKEDISSRKLAESTIRQLAYYDTLTNLPNRRLFADRLEQAAATLKRSGGYLALFYLDPDRLKTINDTLGHAAGDQLLKLMAERIGKQLRQGDTLARLHGDAFALLVNEIAEEEHAVRVAEKIMEAMRLPFHIGGNELFISTSIGISVYPSDTADLEVLHQHADTALHRAKQLGGNNFQFFTADMNALMVQRLKLENSLRRALEREEFELHYQPQVDIKNGQISGAEVLLRWRSPELGLVAPGNFIHLAEETGLIVPIGEWVLRTACAQAMAWQNQGLRPMRFAINLSARQFREGNLVQIVTGVLAKTGLPPNMLELELTESIIMEKPEQTIATLKELNGLGIQISIDDFGTGYSSLSYLKRLPIQVLKIDQSFVRDISTDPDDKAIVSAVVALAHSLKLKVIAEGVETREQLAYLREIACDDMQGYYYSRPLSADDFGGLLEEGKLLALG